MSECVKVVVRCRPINKKEIANGCKECVKILKNINQLQLLENTGDRSESTEKNFSFDAVYGADSTQRQVYDETAFPLVESVIQGYNGTIFAYGQTGCGKTHTMMGEKSIDQRGIIPSAFEHIYGYIDDSRNSNKKFLVRCSFLEIYNEDVRDLLSDDIDRKLELKENEKKVVYVKDLNIITVKNVAVHRNFDESRDVFEKNKRDSYE